MADHFGAPPSALDLSESHIPRNNAVAVSLTLVASLAVALRLFTRARVQRVPWMADDWFILASLVPTYASLACIIAGRSGLGRHVWAASIEDYIHINQIGFIYILVYFLTLPLIKLSILLFYRRLFAFWIPRALYLCIFLTIGQSVACIITSLCACRPPSHVWRQWVEPQGGSCVIDMNLFQLVTACINIGTDLLILALPVPLVWRLQMRPLQKGLVVGVFLLGSFVCVASAIRMWYMVRLGHNRDWTWLLGDAYVWTAVEPCIGIVCACLPALNPLVRRGLQRIGLMSAGAGGSGSSPIPTPTPTRGETGDRTRLYGRRTQKGRTGDGRRYRGDETLLRTAATVEMDGLRRAGEGELEHMQGHQRGHAGPGSCGTAGSASATKEGELEIQVQTDFQWREEHR
ncbi:putative integral membrane protein Pth11-like [Aspergillus mulundensis]|uniref:Rhodopsin domain-containing protein n=1 Tax=Aspergillus mulundensis TaxID=1810919 RepID=A0A3D8QV44_9EURO|nr:hypothetical protein DSM5745_09455 [Aspergillus mulundensis]RDW65716.1 hypothetical protein DSM5745_09455 [Aspergillus mulundensis]